jgi:hypothetical protein
VTEPGSPGAPLIIRYGGSWFRTDILIIALLGCVFAAALAWASLAYWGHHSFALLPAAVFAVFWLVFPGYVFFIAAQALISIRRFRLQIDKDAVIYRRMFRDSAFHRAQMGAVHWFPGVLTGVQQQPPFLWFYANDGGVLFKVNASWLSVEQTHEISRALHTPIEDLPER